MVLTIIFAALAVIFLVLFCVMNATARSLEKDRDDTMHRLQLERQELSNLSSRFTELTHRNRHTEKVLQDTQRDMLTVEKSNRDLQDELGNRRKLCGIKFTANIPLVGWTKTEFKLGIGPCGKEVLSVQLEEKADRYVITQWCTDGERKEFEYKKEDVAGRIERAYRPHQRQ